MSITTVTEEDVESRLDTLREEFGEFSVQHETSTDSPERFEQTAGLAKDGWRGDAGVLATDPDGRYLLIRHSGTPNEWGIPGGGHKPGESMCETARREFREETGLTCTLENIIHTRIKRIEHETDPTRHVYMLTVWFEGETKGGEISIGDEEVLAVSWFDELPDDLFYIIEDHAK